MWLLVTSAFLMCASAQAKATGEKNVFPVTAYGATPDGETISTKCLQQAIDACGKAGGGIVHFPEGTYLSGGLRMKSGVTLELVEGATLLGSRKLQDYYHPPEDIESSKPDILNLIHGTDLKDVGIRGPGTIDGNGSAFRHRNKPRTKCIYFENCQGILVENVKLRSAGCWMQHYRLCEDVTIRRIDVFNHVAFNNDGMNLDSCKHVRVSDCVIDSDDDAIVLKSLSLTPCEDIVVQNCVAASHCNALKMGTESGGGFVDITIERCKVHSPQKSKVTYGRQRGLAGIALEIVDGGRMENVTVRDVEIQGVSVPIFLRLGNRAREYVKGSQPGVGSFKNVRLSRITAKETSRIGCSITGIPGYPLQDVVLEDISLDFEGGGTRSQADAKVPEKEKAYPESTMFGELPAYGFLCRHVEGISFHNLKLGTEERDLRHALLFEDARDISIRGLDVKAWEGAAPSLKLMDSRRFVLEEASQPEEVQAFVCVEGATSQDILLRNCDLRRPKKAIVLGEEVSGDAVRGE